MCPAVVAEPCLPSVQSSAVALFVFYGQDLVSVVSVGQSGAPWALIESGQVFVRDPGASNFR